MRPRPENPRPARSAAGTLMLAVLTAACTTTPPATVPPAPPAVSAPSTSAATTAPAPTTRAAPLTIDPNYAPTIDPARFSTTIDNPYFPLTVGTRFVYQVTTADGTERNIVEVTPDTRTVLGVQTRVVHDVVLVDGKPEEDAYDWYAQDADGNVWYFGEATRALDGQTPDTSGSFEAGKDGALPGIAMPAAPVIGDHYRQEYYRGEAEDTGKVLSLTGTETAPFTGARSDLLVTEDVNPLDPAAGVENKFYAKGVGLVVSAHVSGPSERAELVAVEKS